MPASVVLAHAGGVPEVAMVAVPLALLVAFGLFERRARQREAERDTGGDDGVDEPGRS